MTTQPVGKTETFTASNGLIFTFPEDGSVRWEQGHPPRFVTEALREYFQHESDLKWGRWRDTENPHMVVYRVPENDDKDGRAVRVIDEATGVYASLWERGVRFDPDAPESHAPAAHYFAAHPEPKPWHDAKPGDVWILTINDEQAPATAFLDKNTGQILFATPTFTDLEPGRHLITAGTRIWPTEFDDE